ncbi:MAG: galactose mutarotase [Oscillospiraceae bacterium]|nr:galactose mutarotase [Oscillospiraceae bacterium]
MESFGYLGSVPVGLIRLDNGEISCEVITYGAAIRSLTVPDGNGRPRDVVLGFDTLQEYRKHDCYFGAAIGPVANRIAGAACELNGQVLRLTKNDGDNCNHSGTAGLNARLWSVMEETDASVTLSCIHPNGLGGIPGELRVAVTYRLRGRALCIEYWAVSSRDTLCSLTNHSYFNLDGHDSGPVNGHRVTLFSHSYTPTDAHSIPTGEIRAVAGTPMDLSHATLLGDRLDLDYEPIRNAGGYDHNWLIDPNDEGMGFRPAALVRGADSGIRMSVYTDRPCVQLYTGNYIPEGLAGKGGAVYHLRQGLALETQGFPDAPHHPSFPSITLRAGKVWQSRTEYRFG